MKKILDQYKFRIINFLILSLIAYYSFATFFSAFSLSFFILSICNAILIQGILLISSKYRILIIALACFISLIIAIEVTHITAYSSRLTFAGIASIYETNGNEALNMLSSLKGYIFLFSITFIIVVISCLSIRNEQLNTPIKIRNIFISIFLSIILTCSISYSYIFSDRLFFSAKKNEILANPLLAITEQCISSCPSFFYTTSLTIGYIKEKYELKKALSSDQELPNSLIINNKTGSRTPSTIFIVIGETSNRDHYSLYGYEILTTPNLNQLQSNEKLLSYKSLSPASVTRDAVPFLLTFGTPLNPNNQFKEKNIITLAKDLGYQTYWISNQDQLGLNDTSIGYIACRSDHQKYFTKSTFDVGREDLNLIEEAKLKYDPTIKQLFILHLRGSHQAYENGYDNTDRERIDSVTSSHPIFLEYDRTIHHTDRVLGKLYDIFFSEEKKDSLNNKVLFYTSDHGEIVNVGHGVNNENIAQFKIPFIVFGSSYFNQVDSLMNKYTNNNIFNSSNFPYIFSEIIGYKVKEEAQRKAKEEGSFYKKPNREIGRFTTDID